jgi:hypothetical protein
VNNETARICKEAALAFKGIATRAEVHTDCKQHVNEGQTAECEYAYEAGSLINELRC